MKKPIIIILILLVIAFFTFFRIGINKNDTLDFINQYKTEIEFSDFKIEKNIIADDVDNELHISFFKCDINNLNVKEYASISKKIAKEINKKLNKGNEFKYINVIFIPINPNGIKLTNTIQVYDLNYRYSIDKL